MANIAIFSTTPNSVTLYIEKLDGEWEGGTRTMYWYLRANGTPSATVYDHGTNGHPLVANSNLESNAVEISGLSPNTTYGVLCEVYYGTSKLASLTGEVKTAAPSRPANFYWTNSKTQGGTFNLTAKEWNALTKRINEFRAYRNLSNYSFDTAYTGYEFTADMYNQARLALQGIPGFGIYIPTVSSGGNVTAYALNMFVSEIEAIP